MSPRQSETTPIVPYVKRNEITGYNSTLRALEMRTLRRQVRQTASLISVGKPVKEEPGPNWACDVNRRVIYWRPTTAWPPYEDLTKRDILFLITHEAGHLNYTGGYGWPVDFTDDDKVRFHRFYNFVEDFRIERLSEKEFPGFEPLRKEMNAKALGFHADKPVEGYSVIDGVGLAWACMENGITPFGRPDLLDFARKTWNRVRLLANSKSSQDLVTGLLPIYRELMKDIPDADALPELPEGLILILEMGPSDAPQRSPFEEGQEPIPFDVFIKGLAKDAKGAAKGALEIWVKQEQAQERKAENQAQQVMSTAGTQYASPRQPDDSWLVAEGIMRPEINALSHRLRITLKTNAAGNWLENQRRGIINPHRAYRAVAGDPRIFRKRLQIGSLDYTLGITGDCSSSMSQRADTTLKTIVMIGMSWERAGLPWFLVPWGTKPYGIKGFGDRIIDHRDHIGANIAHPRGGTYEAPALVIAQEQFERVRSGHKLLFLLTDGETIHEEESETLINELMGMGVRCVDIAIGFSPTPRGTIALRVESPSELVQILPRYINEMVRKGR